MQRRPRLGIFLLYLLALPELAAFPLFGAGKTIVGPRPFYWSRSARRRPRRRDDAWCYASSGAWRTSAAPSSTTCCRPWCGAGDEPTGGRRLGTPRATPAGPDAGAARAFEARDAAARRRRAAPRRGGDCESRIRAADPPRRARGARLRRRRGAGLAGDGRVGPGATRHAATSGADRKAQSVGRGGSLPPRLGGGRRAGVLAGRSVAPRQRVEEGHAASPRRASRGQHGRSRPRGPRPPRPPPPRRRARGAPPRAPPRRRRPRAGRRCRRGPARPPRGRRRGRAARK